MKIKVTDELKLNDSPAFLLPRCCRGNLSWLLCTEIKAVFILKAHTFPRATLSENHSPLGTGNVNRQLLEHIFAPNGCYYILSFILSFKYFSQQVQHAVLNIWEYHPLMFPSVSSVAYPVTLIANDQLCTSENIILKDYSAWYAGEIKYQ